MRKNSKAQLKLMPTDAEPKYFAAEGSRLSNQDAEVIGPVLEQLAKSGASTARDIVAAAEGADSPLHPYFEWDDGAAGAQYREIQARQLARSIKVTVADSATGQPIQTRAFFAIKLTTDNEARNTSPNPASYQSIKVVAADHDKSAHVLKEALSNLIAWKKRYGAYRALFPQVEEVLGPIFEAIEVVSQQDQNLQESA